MAMFKDSPHYEIHDDYYTPKSAWEQLKDIIPNDKIIWEAFLLGSVRSKSINNLKELGKNVVGNTDWDYFEKCNELEYAMQWSKAVPELNITREFHCDVCIQSRFKHLAKRMGFRYKVNLTKKGCVMNLRRTT